MNFSFVNNLSFKSVILVSTIIYIPVIFKIALMGFQTDDKIPSVEAVDLKMRQQYRMVTSEVRTGLFIKRFAEFNLANNNFVIDGILWFEFNADEISNDIISKFSIENGKILYKSDPDVKLNGNRAFFRYNVLFQVFTNLSFKRFPLEDHRVSIIVGNEYVTPNELYFSGNIPLVIAKDADFSEWRVYKLTAETGFVTLPLDENNEDRKVSSPRVVFTIDFRRDSIKDLMVIFIPLFASALFSLLTFLMGLGNLRGRFTLSVSAVTALLGYRFVIDRLMPKVGYFTTTDKLYIFLLVFCLLIFAFHLIAARYYTRGKEDEGKQGESLVKSEVTSMKLQTLDMINSIAYLTATVAFLVIITLFIGVL